MKKSLLENFIPSSAKQQVQDLLQYDNIRLIIKSERKTKHGDYRSLPNGRHQITVNANLNPYRFLMTLIHEIAHLRAYKTYGNTIKPHGKEWKHTFKYLMLPFLKPEIFPKKLLPLLALHFKNPKASSDTDVVLARVLKQYDTDFENKTYVYQLKEGDTFKLYNGRQFKKGHIRRKRVVCTELSSGGVYLFNPNAEVELL